MIAVTAEHTWNNGEEIKSSTCTEKGEKEFFCIVCGEKRKEKIKELVHTYKTTVTKATTAKNGSVIEKCTACGDIKSSRIIPSVTTVVLKSSSQTYNGKAKKPSVIVKNSSGKVVDNHNYTVVYKNNKKIGKGAVIIELKGNYTGIITKTFKILPKGTTISGKITARPKGFLVKWKKQKKNITGYQIQYSTNKKFKKKATVTKTVKKKSVTKMNVKKLKPEKKYYVRIRTYKTVKGRKYCSGWSKAKSVIIKK